MPKTNTQKQSERREKLSHGGLFKRRDFWCHPDDEQALRALESVFRVKRIKSEDSSAAESHIIDS